MSLQNLFDQPILECVELDPGFEEHGSHVFRVRTPREHAVARAFRLDEVEGPFWGNLNALFGINPLRASEVVSIHARLGDISVIPVPRVLKIGVTEHRDWVIVEFMKGNTLKRFDALTDEGLLEFGRNLGTIHRGRFDTLGTPSGSFRFAPFEFPERLSATLRRSIERYPDDSRLAGMIDDMCATAAGLPPPTSGALVMPDISPGQFLHEGGRIVAMTDIDAYVVCPRELEFICLEYFIDERSATLIGRGYNEILPLPRLAPIRPVYRYFCRLLTIRTDIDDIDKWMSWPEWFR